MIAFRLMLAHNRFYNRRKDNKKKRNNTKQLSVD